MQLDARDNNSLPAIRKGQEVRFGEWSDLFLENFSKPPFRAPKTHGINQRALKHLRAVFENVKLAELTADNIETYLRGRLKQRVSIKTKSGVVEKGVLKATTVHQELRVLRRMLNVAVRKKLLFANPCAGLEFPVRVNGLFRPHYITWSEQQKIEFNAPVYLRNVIRIITETGLRVYKELPSMRKENVDLDNKVMWIPDSKTPNGVAEVPLTDIAAEAFRRQLAISGPGPYLFPSEASQTFRENRSRRFSVSRFGGQVWVTSGSMIFVRRTQLASARVALRTSGSRSCRGKATRRSSRNTRR